MKTFILVTGGTGFIGVHTVYNLLKYGYNVLIINNFSNTSVINIKGLHSLHKQLENNTQLLIKNINLLDFDNMRQVFSDYKIDSIIHLASLKSMGESIQNPILYYKNNIMGTINLIQCAIDYNINNFIFSSSATIYGSEISPLQEDSSKIGVGVTNPYTRTKIMIEQILQDTHKSSNINIIILRYFNPIGAHPSGLIGELPVGTPTNIFPYILDIAEGKRKILEIFGNNYDTYDGTCVRDFIHIMDLAEAHCKSLNFLEAMKGKKICEAINIGTGIGTSVLSFIEIFRDSTGINIPYIFSDKRERDIPTSFADVSKAKKLLNWSAKRTLIDMCKDGWNFRQKIQPIQ